MPSLHHAEDRHVVIDHRPGHYLCFPDACMADDGTLLVAYNEFDRHVGRRQKLLLKSSTDGGRSFSPARVLRVGQSHCPRMTRLDGGELILSDDMGHVFFFSQDHGATWAQTPPTKIEHGLLDRVIQFDENRLLITGHKHRGTYGQPCIGQPPAEQMVYVSENRGLAWTPLSVMCFDRRLVLCEGSIARTPDGALICLLRENTGIFEPMYLCRSLDEGRTWSEPRPTPLIGHRPTMGVLDDGRVLVTYRNVAPDGGVAAWLGGLDELDQDFAVHGLAPDPASWRRTDAGLAVEHEAGPDHVVRYALRPMTDPVRAAAELEAEVLCEGGGESGCGLRLGVWWKIRPDHVVADAPDAEPVAIEPGKIHCLRLEYSMGSCALFVDGERKTEIAVDVADPAARAVMFGTAAPDGDNAGNCLWKRIKQRVVEPRYGRDYLWSWHHSWGMPDDWAARRVLELKNDRKAAGADYGYSGWCALPGDGFFCAYHYGGGGDEGYEPGFSARVLGTRFSADDFQTGFTDPFAAKG